MQAHRPRAQPWTADPVAVAAYGLFHCGEVASLELLDAGEMRMWRRSRSDDELRAMASAIDAALSDEALLVDILPDLRRTESEVRHYLRVVRRTFDVLLAMPPDAERIAVLQGVTVHRASDAALIVRLDVALSAAWRSRNPRDSDPIRSAVRRRAREVAVAEGAPISEIQDADGALLEQWPP